MAALHGHIISDDATLRYLVEGSGPAVMVLGSSVYYPRTFSARFKRSYRVAYADMRHFAETERPTAATSISITSYLDDIDRLRKAAGLDRFILVGHSHHGNLAVEYTKAFPEHVTHLVLIGTPPCGVEQTLSESQRYWDQHASLLRKEVRTRNNASLARAAASSSDPAATYVRQYIADAPVYWCDPYFDASFLWDGVPMSFKYLAAFRSFFVDYVFSYDAATLDIPVLAVAGAHDYAVPPTLWSEALRNAPGMTCVLLGNSGHTPQLEEPEQFDQILEDWLTDK